MKRVLLVLFGLSVVVGGMQEADAQRRRGNQGLPKVDFQIQPIYKVGQGLAAPVRNGGFERSPGAKLTVAIYDRQSRQLLKVESRQVAALQPGQTRREIVVPPTRNPVLVRATIDPGNRVPETNERNNKVASHH